VFILKSQRVKIVYVKIYTWCKNHVKCRNVWESSETTNVTVNGTQSYHCSVNGQEALNTLPARKKLTNIN